MSRKPADFAADRSPARAELTLLVHKQLRETLDQLAARLDFASRLDAALADYKKQLLAKIKAKPLSGGAMVAAVVIACAAVTAAAVRSLISGLKD